MAPVDSWLTERQTFYDRISGVYDAMSDHYEHTSREQGVALLEVITGDRVLEIGYGTGHALEALARRVGDSGKVLGLEVSSGMQREAEKRLRSAGLMDRVNLLRGDGRALPVGTASLDAVFLSFALELFEGESLNRLLDECRRVLKSGGKMGVVSLSDGTGETLAVRIYEWLHEKFPHFIDCRPIHVRATLENAGFSVTAAESGEVWKLPVEIVVAQKA